MDRFVAVVFPFKAKLITPKARFICIGCSWIVAIAVHAPYFYTFKLVRNPYDNKLHCASDWGPAFDNVETHKRYITATFIIFFSCSSLFVNVRVRLHCMDPKNSEQRNRAAVVLSSTASRSAAQTNYPNVSGNYYCLRCLYVSTVCFHVHSNFPVELGSATHLCTTHCDSIHVSLFGAFVERSKSLYLCYFQQELPARF